MKCFIVNLKTYTTLYAHSDSFATPFPESYQDNSKNLSVNGCSELLYPAMPELGCWNNLAATISKREWCCVAQLGYGFPKVAKHQETIERNKEAAVERLPFFAQTNRLG